MSKLNDFDDVMGSLAAVPEMVKNGVASIKCVNHGGSMDMVLTMRDGTSKSLSAPKEFPDEEWEKYGVPVENFMNFLIDMLNEEQVDATVPA